MDIERFDRHGAKMGDNCGACIGSKLGAMLDRQYGTSLIDVIDVKGEDHCGASCCQCGCSVVKAVSSDCAQGSLLWHYIVMTNCTRWYLSVRPACTFYTFHKHFFVNTGCIGIM